jgi:hypothetical protein
MSGQELLPLDKQWCVVRTTGGQIYTGTIHVQGEQILLLTPVSHVMFPCEAIAFAEAVASLAPG